MPFIAFGLRRAIAIKLIPSAFKSGLSAGSWIRQLRIKGLSYRRTDMFGDWRTVNSIEAKKDAYKYVRKDRIPSPTTFADVEWRYNKEYIYKANTWSRTHPDEPLTQRMVTLQADVPLSPKQVEEQITEKWSTYERYGQEKLSKVEAVGFYRKVIKPTEVE